MSTRSREALRWLESASEQEANAEMYRSRAAVEDRNIDRAIAHAKNMVACFAEARDLREEIEARTAR